MAKKSILRKLDGEVFIPLADSGIDLLVALVDRLHIHTLTRSQKPYLNLADVADWYERELVDLPHDKFIATMARETRRIHNEFLASEGVAS